MLTPTIIYHIKRSTIDDQRQSSGAPSTSCRFKKFPHFQSIRPFVFPPSTTETATRELCFPVLTNARTPPFLYLSPFFSSRWLQILSQARTALSFSREWDVRCQIYLRLTRDRGGLCISLFHEFQMRFLFVGLTIHPQFFPILRSIYASAFLSERAESLLCEVDIVLWVARGVRMNVPRREIAQKKLAIARTERLYSIELIDVTEWNWKVDWNNARVGIFTDEVTSIYR